VPFRMGCGHDEDGKIAKKIMPEQASTTIFF